MVFQESSGFQPVPQQPVRTRQQHKGRRHDRRKRKDLQQIGLRKGQHQHSNEIGRHGQQGTATHFDHRGLTRPMQVGQHKPQCKAHFCAEQHEQLCFQQGQAEIHRRHLHRRLHAHKAQCRRDAGQQ